MKPNPFQIFLMAIRPKTLWAAAAPVLIGTAMAFRDGLADLPSALLCFATAIMIQIGTNLANDYFDFKKGTDTEDRLGPMRVTQAGLVKPEIIKFGFIFCFVLAALISLALVNRGGPIILVIAICSILSGICYTAGPFPLGYLGLGEIFVLIFFGPVAVGGTYYIQALEINASVLLAGLGPGFLATAILIINNLRDIDGDRRAGKNTLAVRFGRAFALREYLFSVFAGCLTPLLVYAATQDYMESLIAVAALFVFIPSITTVLTTTEGKAFNQALAKTGQLLLFYSILFSGGFLMPIIIRHFRV